MVLLELTLAISIIFVSFYILYYLICYTSSKPNINASEVPTPANLPTVSIIIPAYNEASVIKQKISNLTKTNYPMDKLEVVFVDGGSNDGTVDQIKNLSGEVSFTLMLVEQGQRKGFNAAVIDGFHHTTGDIIFITGAETQYEPNAVRIMVNHFSNQRIGAVNGAMKVSNYGEGLSTQLETAYRGLYDFIRLSESNIDSPFDIKGEIAASRRSICQHLVDNPLLTKKGCIDACVSFQAKLDGYRTIYDPSAVYYEPAPRSMRDSFRQQIRRGATLIENLLVFKRILFRRKYGYFGTVIMPAHFFMLVVMPAFFMIALVGFLALAILNPTNYLLVGLCLFGGLSILLSRRMQAFVKTQITLIAAGFKMLRGVETQKFARLASVRPDKSEL